jgi:hypothetical protein
MNVKGGGALLTRNIKNDREKRFFYKSRRSFKNSPSFMLGHNWKGVKLSPYISVFP